MWTLATPSCGLWREHQRARPGACDGHAVVPLEAARLTDTGDESRGRAVRWTDLRPQPGADRRRPGCHGGPGPGRSHNDRGHSPIGFAKEVADKVVFIDEGVKIEEAPAERFFSQPTQDRTKLFLSKILI